MANGNGGSVMDALERAGKLIKEVGFPVVACLLLLWQLPSIRDGLRDLTEGFKAIPELVVGVRDIANAVKAQGDELRLHRAFSERPEFRALPPSGPPPPPPPGAGASHVHEMATPR